MFALQISVGMGYNCFFHDRAVGWSESLGDLLTDDAGSEPPTHTERKGTHFTGDSESSDRRAWTSVGLLPDNVVHTHQIALIRDVLECAERRVMASPCRGHDSVAIPVLALVH